MAKLDTFKKILQQKQFDLKQMLKDYLVNKEYSIVEGDGFLYGIGDIPIMLVAHMDTVHLTIPEHIFYDEEQQIMWSPEGIGGDDRCGVYIITRILHEGYQPYVLFLEDEEIGCIGASKCVKVLKAPDVRYIVEIDRRGSDDCVFYDCDNPKFTEYVESFGFEEAIGSYSDICELSDEWGIASVNVSAGYYNEHTEKEFISLSDMEKTFGRIIDMLEDDKKEYYEFIKKKYHYVSYSYTNPKKNNKSNNKNDNEELDKESEYLNPIDYLDCDEYGFQGADGKWYDWDHYDGYKKQNEAYQ